MKVWAGWLGLAMALSVALAGCSSNNTTAVTLSISPTTSTVLLGTSIQFVPAEAGSENGIQWSVDGINNGNATVGTIDSTGLYTAPETLPVPPSGVVVPVLYCEPNAGIAGSGSTGSIIELQGGFDFTNFAVGNTITITGNSVAGWDTSFVIVASGPLGNGNFGVQITTPAGPPLVGTGGSATVTPGVTIGAQIEETSVVAQATVTLDSGIRVSLAQTSFTIGTNEQYLFSSANAFGPTVIVTGTSNQAVAWSVTSGTGTINPNSGLYTAPSTPETDTVTVTSLADNTQFASATVNVVTAVDPTVSSISPPNGALGAAFQEVFITGNNFISTTNVFLNGALLPSGALFATTPTTLFVIVPDSVLSNFPVSGSTVPLTFTVGRQSGAQQSCSPLPCQLVLSPVRPALVASKPDSVQASASSTAITLDGGYFGTTSTTLGFQGNPMVNVQFAGQGTSFSFNSDRELLVTATPGAVSVPGLYPITVKSAVSGSANGSMAAANLAVQPVSTPSSIASPTVGTSPSAVAINSATGVAVVANQGSNDITVVSLPDGPLAAGAIVTQSLCTGALGSGSASSPGCVASAPVSVAVDNIRNLALVANSAVANPTLAVVNLAVSPPQVTALLTFPSADIVGNPFALIPRAVGINPVSGRALVAFTSSATTGSNVGAILDMNQVQNISGSVTMPATGANPVLINAANISNGLNTRIAVSPRLNWALATPGGVGALSIVDLGRQTVNQISGIGCVPGTSGTSTPTVTVTTTAVNSLQVGQPVLIAGVSPASFNGIFSVTAANNFSFQYYSQTACPSGSGAPSGSGGTASYANPVASVGVDLNVRAVSVNDETEKALLVDPTSSEPAFIFNILDQSSTPVNNLPTSTSNITGAINPLTNGALVLNKGGQAYVVDPTVPTVICSTQPCSATFNTSTTPVDVAIDPVTNTAVIVNQGGTLSLYSLGASTSNPQIIQTSVAPIASSQQTSSLVTLNSSLGSPATVSNQTVTLIGHFDGSSVPQLDGDPSPFTGHTLSANGRVMTATVSGTTLAANGPRRYAVQAADSTTVASNAARLPVIQAVSLVTGDCSAPAPQGVAINSGVTSLGQIYSAAIVTEPGCNDVSMVSLSDSSGFTHGTGFGPSPELAVQSDPQGVDVYSPAGLAVVANAGSSSVSIVDMVNDDVPVTFNTDPIPDGVAIDLGTGNALVTANGASVVDTFAVSTTAQTPSNIGVQQSPSGVAIDPLRGVAVAANSASGSNDASILNLSSNSTTFTTTAGSIIFPQGVAFDPISDTFMITSGSNNQVVLLNPVTDQSTAIRVGIDPSSIAYNAVSGTLVTANNLSSTVTMVDFLDQTVRAVFSLNSSTQFAVAIQPQTNLAVIADSADNQLLLVPLPN